MLGAAVEIGNWKLEMWKFQDSKFPRPDSARILAKFPISRFQTVTSARKVSNSRFPDSELPASFTWQAGLEIGISDFGACMEPHKQAVNMVEGLWFVIRLISWREIGRVGNFQTSVLETASDLQFPESQPAAPQIPAPTLRPTNLPRIPSFRSQFPELSVAACTCRTSAEQFPGIEIPAHKHRKLGSISNAPPIFPGNLEHFIISNFQRGKT